MARPMIIKSKLPSPFWAEAINTANKIRNCLPTKSLPNKMSPHEAWFGNKPSINHLRQFGCIAYHRLPDEVITPGQKINPRSIKCCLVGYIGNQIYRLWTPVQQKIIVSRNMIFKENEFFHLSVFDNIPISQHTFQTPSMIFLTMKIQISTILSFPTSQLVLSTFLLLLLLLKSLLRILLLYLLQFHLLLFRRTMTLTLTLIPTTMISPIYLIQVLKLSKHPHLFLLHVHPLSFLHRLLCCLLLHLLHKNHKNHKYITPNSTVNQPNAKPKQTLALKSLKLAHKLFLQHIYHLLLDSKSLH